MTNKAKILDMINRSANINIIGDSLGAGIGSSGSYLTDEILLQAEGHIIYRRIAPNSWWGKFEEYLHDKYPGCNIRNTCFGGAYSYQVRDLIDNLTSERDDIIFIFIGTNDRKRQNGMTELYNNLIEIIKHLKQQNKLIILLTPNPSTVQNNLYCNRFFHSEDVANVLLHVAERERLLLIDNYNYIQEYLFIRDLKIDDIILGNCPDNDGLHPPDFVQELMFRNLMKGIGLSLKVENASW